MRYLRHPLGQLGAIMVAAYLVIDVGIVHIPPLVGIDSAPVPNSVLLQYMITVLVGALLFVSADEDRWREFKEPIHEVLVNDDYTAIRNGLLVAIPLLIGSVTFLSVRPTVAAPSALRSIHPAPPSQITFQGRQLVLDGLENPLREEGSLDEHYELGKRLYYQNCMACHGDALRGQGHYAHGFSPAPIDLSGTLNDLTESFVFWRIAKGGPGLPVEGAPWNSAMPVWEDYMTEAEIWSVIIFLYEQTGLSPRTWEHAGGEGGEEH